jgi:hypothetical protein
MYRISTPQHYNTPRHYTQVVVAVHIKRRRLQMNSRMKHTLLLPLRVQAGGLQSPQ